MFRQGRFEMIFLILVVFGVGLQLVSCDDLTDPKDDGSGDLKGQCSGTGQLCGSLELAYPKFPSLNFKAKSLQLCCSGLICDNTVKTNIGKDNEGAAGLCYPKDGKKVECVGHHLPCAQMKTVTDSTISCCSNDILQHKYDTTNISCSDKIDAFGIKAGFCITADEEPGCMAAGFPCGKADIPAWGKGELKCCDNLKCNDFIGAPGYGSAGFCEGKSGGHRAGEGASTEGGGDSASPSSSVVPKSSIGQLTLAFIFTTLSMTTLLSYK